MVQLVGWLAGGSSVGRLFLQILSAAATACGSSLLDYEDTYM